METPKQDVQTVTPEGEPVQRFIEGVKIASAVTHPDERGTLCEISSLALRAHPAPIVYVYRGTDKNISRDGRRDGSADRTKAVSGSASRLSAGNAQQDHAAEPPSD